MISIIAVDYHSGEFKDILEDSLKKTTTGEYELLIHNNGSDFNVGHGRGLDALMSKAKGEYILVLDIDSHILLKDWDTRLINRLNKVDMIACEGGQLKPIRPCGMFFRKSLYIENAMTFQAQNCNGVKFDVGVHFYFKALSLGKKVELFPYAKTEYKDVIGNEYTFEGERFLFHHWYATRWFNVYGKKVHDKIDNVKWDDFYKSKESLLKQYEFNEKPDSNYYYISKT